MYEHVATRANLETLRLRGATVIEPGSGHLASGRTGKGRLAEPAEIVEELRRFLGRARDLAGKRVVVTAGGTQEPIDPVRFVGNHSSGKMGFAVAEAARDRGATVVLISGPATVPIPGGVEVTRIGSALDLKAAVERAVPDADAIVMAAAVADYRVAEVAKHKLKRTGDELVLRLVPNPDVVAGIQHFPLVKVGFAAETDELIARATEKLRRKGLDFIVANDVSKPGSGFGTDTNEVTIIDASGVESLPLLSKREVADRILDRVAKLLSRRSRWQSG
jgi:phosphopantothenoylcysteine decarboxylase/phosphopantothenate--cysteine ligase